MPTLHKDDILAHADASGSIDIHITEPKYSLETYVPIVADYFDKNLHYDATHYLYEPDNMSELLNKPVDDLPTDKPKGDPMDEPA